jgi:hypothetical protein
MSVDLTADGDTLRPSTPVLLFSKPRLPEVLNSLFSVDGRGERFLLVQQPESATAATTEQPITVVLNFVQSLARK